MNVFQKSVNQPVLTNQNYLRFERFVTDVIFHSQNQLVYIANA